MASNVPLTHLITLTPAFHLLKVQLSLPHSARSSRVPCGNYSTASSVNVLTLLSLCFRNPAHHCLPEQSALALSCFCSVLGFCHYHLCTPLDHTHLRIDPVTLPQGMVLILTSSTGFRYFWSWSGLCLHVQILFPSPQNTCKLDGKTPITSPAPLQRWSTVPRPGMH